MSDFVVSRNAKIIALIYLLAGFLFLTQTILNAEFVPLRGIVLYLGLPDSGMGIIMLGIYLIAFNVLVTIILSIYTKFHPEKKKWALEIFNVQFTNAMLGFFTIVVMLLSFAAMATVKILPMAISYSQVASLYIFWFLILKAFGKIVKVEIKK